MSLEINSVRYAKSSQVFPGISNYFLAYIWAFSCHYLDKYNKECIDTFNSIFVNNIIQKT